MLLYRLLSRCVAFLSGSSAALLDAVLPPFFPPLLCLHFFFLCSSLFGLRAFFLQLLSEPFAPPPRDHTAGQRVVPVFRWCTSCSFMVVTATCNCSFSLARRSRIRRDRLGPLAFIHSLVYLVVAIFVSYLVPSEFKVFCNTFMSSATRSIAVSRCL